MYIYTVYMWVWANKRRAGLKGLTGLLRTVRKTSPPSAMDVSSSFPLLKCSNNHCLVKRRQVCRGRT